MPARNGDRDGAREGRLLQKRPRDAKRKGRSRGRTLNGAALPFVHCPFFFQHRQQLMITMAPNPGSRMLGQAHELSNKVTVAREAGTVLTASSCSGW